MRINTFHIPTDHLSVHLLPQFMRLFHFVVVIVVVELGGDFIYLGYWVYFLMYCVLYFLVKIVSPAQWGIFLFQ